MRPTEVNSKSCRQPMRRTHLAACAAGLAFCSAALLAGMPAAAQEFTLHAEPAAAFWLDEPQSNRFTPGFYFAVRPGIALGRVVALQWSYALLLAPANDGYAETGSAHSLSTGVRVRPLATLQPESGNLDGLFVDSNLGYFRTGALDRFGFDAGLGYGFEVTPWFSLGPVLRYGQIVQSSGVSNQDSGDAQFITVGLDLGLDPMHEKSREPECPMAWPCAQQEKQEVAPVVDRVAVVVPGCPDRDQDGVCDADDRCPMQIGPSATLGCPIDPCSGSPLMVLVQFEFDSAELPPPKDGTQTMDPVLDAVAEAITQDPSCRVCIVGNASEEGPAEHNEDLSRRRAVAVQSYLTVRGLVETRMPTTGLGSRCQLVPESTRSLNRRVEFRRLQEGEACPLTCSK